MTVLIPAYEPDERMITLLHELISRTRYPILIVDDGSGEQYRAIFDQAEAMGCRVLRLPCNQGKGNALKAGFAKLRERGEKEGVVCADCDGQHLVEDIVKCAEQAILHKRVMVLGMRRFIGRVPFRSRLGNTVTRYVFYLASGTKVYDVQTGLRAYSADMFEYLESLSGARFEYEMNLLVCCKRDGYGLLEVPIATVYNLDNHTSHFRTFSDTVCVAKALLRFNVSSIAAFLLDMVLFFAVLYSLTAVMPELGSNLTRLAAVVFARIISATANYLLNKRYVFGGATRNSFFKYVLVVIVIAALNYILQSILVELLHLPNEAAKPLVELLLFLLSFLLQRTFVFKYV